MPSSLIGPIRAATRDLLRRGLPVALLCGTLLLAVPCRALDFRLHEVKTEDDGFTHVHSCFRYDDRTEIMIDLPRHWSVTDDVSSISAVPPGGANTLLRIAKSPFPSNASFQKADLDAYRAQVLAGVPQGSVNVRVLEEKADPLPVFGWKDYQFTMAYDFFGQSFRRSVLFINLNPKEQLMVTVVAGQADFDKVYEASMDVMRSWSPVPAT